MLKNMIFLVLIALTAMAITSCAGVKSAAVPLAQAAPLSAIQVDQQTGPSTITVVGEGKVSLEPDMATINVGAEAREDTVAEARAEVEATMTNILDALKEKDISEKDIQTSHYVIHYEREPLPMAGPGSEPSFRQAYYVSNMVRVIIRDVEMGR